VEDVLSEDVRGEIDKLRARRLELTNRMNMTTSFDEKDVIREDLLRITRQIEVLEKLAKG
jgi:hypothetical protein